jgi:acetylornithine deacetylase/succinyl-diaminopimelate desuccinylase-like protein
MLSFAGDAATVNVTEQPRTTYTGQTRDFASIFPPFATSPDNILATTAKTVIEASTGQPACPDVWKFATDGGHLALAGIPCIGFGPGDDSLAHTNQERLSIDQLNTAAATYAPLACAMAAAIDGN